MSTNTKLTQYHYKQQTMWTGSRKYCELNIWFIISDICINLHFNETKVENTQINFFSNIIKIMKIGKYYVEQFWWTDSLHEKYPNTDVHWSVFPTFIGQYFPIFSPTTGKLRPEKVCIWTLLKGIALLIWRHVYSAK